jgi:putative transposase
VRQVREKLDVSERAACRAVDQPRSTQRYRGRGSAQRRSAERALCERMRELALRHPRYGYRRMTALLRQEGFAVNRKRVHRLWRKEGLKVPRQKQHKRGRIHDGSSDNACHRRRAERVNQVWSFDFCHDLTADGRPLKIFSVIDEFTRRCLVIEVQRHITGEQVMKVLAALVKLQGAPQHVRCDNGPEFICTAVRAWLKRSEVGALYIAPGSPWENGYAESYHARLRDEVLDREEFGSLIEARALLEIWRLEYNGQRPHGALGYLTPDAFATAQAQAAATAVAAYVGHAEPCSATLRRPRHDQREEEELRVNEKCCAVSGTKNGG